MICFLSASTQVLVQTSVNSSLVHFIFRKLHRVANVSNRRQYMFYIFGWWGMFLDMIPLSAWRIYKNIDFLIDLSVLGKVYTKPKGKYPLHLF